MNTDYLILIKNLYRYNARTGQIYWQPHISQGRRAYLRRCPTNVYQLRVGYDYLRAQDVVWFLVHGTWPESPVKHRNGCWWDNRIENLILS